MDDYKPFNKEEDEDDLARPLLRDSTHSEQERRLPTMQFMETGRRLTKGIISILVLEFVYLYLDIARET